MTWGMHAIGHLELGQEEEAARMFDKSYLPYVQVTIQPLDITLRIHGSVPVSQRPSNWIPDFWLF